jgi:putative nucleotidyltransferase with HDIG domain
MSVTPSAQAPGRAALERVALRARATVRADRAALLLRQEPSLLLVAGDAGLEEVATCVLEAGRAVVIRDRGVAAGVPVEAAGKLRGALCVRSADREAIDETHLEILGDLAAMAGDLIEHAERRSKLAGAVEAGVEALAGLLDLRDGSLPRGAAEVVALAHRVADQLVEADPTAAGTVREMLRDRGVADPSAGRFARRTSTAPDAARHSLSAAFERIERLPALAEPRDRLLALLRQERAPLGDIVATIESDIALVIGVLRAANVVAARPSSGVATVREAIAVLAPRGLEVLVERIPAVDFFEQRPAWRTPPERFRLHAVAVQVAADRLGRELGHENHEELAVAALLHDVGKLVLVDAYPGYPGRVHGNAATAEERIHAERRELGIDHALVGGVLVRRLGLPGRLAAAIERHHANDAEGTAAVVRLADLLAHYGHGRPVDPGALLAAARRVGLSPRALRTVMYELPGGMAARRRAAEPSPLTPKEIAAVRGLSEGKLYKEIAVGLGVTTSTVRSHLHAAYRKMGAADRAQAVLIATERGWL